MTVFRIWTLTDNLAPRTALAVIDAPGSPVVVESRFIEPEPDDPFASLPDPVPCPGGDDVVLIGDVCRSAEAFNAPGPKAVEVWVPVPGGDASGLRMVFPHVVTLWPPTGLTFGFGPIEGVAPACEVSGLEAFRSLPGGDYVSARNEWTTVGSDETVPGLRLRARPVPDRTGLRWPGMEIGRCHLVGSAERPPPPATVSYAPKPDQDSLRP